MSYRDELEAAHAQIAALEERLRQPQPERRETSSERELKKKVAQLTHTNQTLEMQVSSLRSSLEAAQPRETPPEAANETLEQTKQVKKLEIQLSGLRQKLTEREQIISEQREDLAKKSASISESQRGIQQLEQQLSKRQRLSRLQTVTEHNRELKPQHQEDRPAGVLCPRCYTAGDEVEMRLGPNQWPDKGRGDVRCPSCLLIDWKKLE